MKRKILLIVCLLLVIITCGCSNQKSLEFKKDYESVNGKTNQGGKEYRKITIDEDNPYEKTDAKTILEKIENKETFYVYFGDKLCPWCRSVIEKSIEVAKKNNIKKIYYIPIWNDEHAEILRDKYVLENGKLKKEIEGTDDYKKLLEIFNDLLSDYTLTNDQGEKVDTGEKRIFAPNYIYIEKGVPKELISGISDKQTDAYEELTKDILQDEENNFKNFFKTS